MKSSEQPSLLRDLFVGFVTTAIWAVIILIVLGVWNCAKADEQQQRPIAVIADGGTVIVFPEQTIVGHVQSHVVKKPACDSTCIERKEAEQQQALDEAMDAIVSGKLIACGYQEPGRLYVREPGPVGGICWPVRFELLLKKWERKAKVAKHRG